MKPLGWRAQCAIWAFQVVLVAFLVPCGKIPDKKQLQRGRTLLRTHSEATGQRGGEGMVAERLLRQLGSEAAGPPVPSDTEQGTMELEFGSSSSFSALLCQGAAHSQCGSSLLS